MKAVLLMLVVMVVVSVDVQAAVPSCLYRCETQKVMCENNAISCFSDESCFSNCYDPNVSCVSGCRRKREFLSRFFKDDGDKKE